MLTCKLRNINQQIHRIHTELLPSKSRSKFMKFYGDRKHVMEAKDIIDLWNKYAKSAEDILIVTSQ